MRRGTVQVKKSAADDLPVCSEKSPNITGLSEGILAARCACLARPPRATVLQQCQNVLFSYFQAVAAKTRGIDDDALDY